LRLETHGSEIGGQWHHSSGWAEAEVSSIIMTVHILVFSVAGSGFGRVVL
jgi:hypothetical protein